MLNLRQNFLTRKTIMFVILILSPILAGWEKTSLSEILDSKRAEKLEEEKQQKSVQEEISRLDITPLRLIQKMSTAFANAQGFKGRMNIWLAHPAFHMNIFLNQQFQDKDNVYIVGQTSFSPTQMQGQDRSLLFNSEWIQSYSLQSLSYLFNPKKKVWQRHKIKLSDEDKLKIVEYEIFESLAMPELQSLDDSSVKIVSLEDYQGKPCFVLEFNLQQEKREKLLKGGNLDKYRAWVDRETYYPYLFRLEGDIAGIEFIQSVEYHDFNTPIKLELPQEIIKDIETEKSQEVRRIGELTQEIKDLRGYSLVGDFKYDFIDAKKLRAIFTNNILEEYSDRDLDMEGRIFKWLGFLPEEFDYREWLISSATFSVGGLYDPKAKTLYLSESLPEYMADAVLSHELEHAYQDLTLDIANFQKVKNNLDESYARHYLLEGEAMAVMLQLVLAQSNRKFEEEADLLGEIRSRFAASKRASDDDILNDLFFSGYGYGAGFIQKAVRQYRWRNLDRVYNNPPLKMREIMHPELYLDQKAGEKKAKLKPLELKNWQVLSQNTLGEYIVLIWLQNYLDSYEAVPAAAGLDDDLIIFYAGDGQKERIIFLARWESEKDTQEFLGAFSKIQGIKMKEGDKKSEEANYSLWHLADKDEIIASHNNLTLVISGRSLEAGEIDSLLQLLKNYQ